MAPDWTPEEGRPGIMYVRVDVCTCACVCMLVSNSDPLTFLLSSPWLEEASLLGSVIFCFNSPHPPTPQLFCFFFLLREHMALIS